MYLSVSLVLSFFAVLSSAISTPWVVCPANNSCLQQRHEVRPLLYLPVEHEAQCKSIDARQIFDLSCLKEANGGLGNTWHLVMECLLHMSQLIEFAERSLRSCATDCDVIALIPAAEWKFISVLFSFDARHVAIIGSDCYNVRLDAVIIGEHGAMINPKGGANWSKANMLAYNITGQILNYRAQEIVRRSALASLQRPVAVVIYRRGKSRSICHFFEEFLPRLQLLIPSYQTVLFYGNESVADTVVLFGRAALVVGYHGAGHANAIFCPESTVVVEYAFQHPVSASSTLLYYSQVEMLCRNQPSLRCFSIGVNPAESLPMTELQRITELYGPNSTKKNWGNPGFIKLHYHPSCVNITPANLNQTITIVSDYLL